jgi:hypothetical protein
MQAEKYKLKNPEKKIQGVSPVLWKLYGQLTVHKIKFKTWKKNLNNISSMIQLGGAQRTEAQLTPPWCATDRSPANTNVNDYPFKLSLIYNFSSKF